MFASGSALQKKREIPLKRLSKIKIQKPWLAKRKVLQVPHLAKLLANNNSVKVWIILD